MFTLQCLFWEGLIFCNWTMDQSEFSTTHFCVRITIIKKIYILKKKIKYTRFFTACLHVVKHCTYILKLWLHRLFKMTVIDVESKVIREREWKCAGELIFLITSNANLYIVYTFITLIFFKKGFRNRNTTVAQLRGIGIIHIGYRAWI